MVNCPVHGPIRPRDDQGQLIHTEGLPSPTTLNPTSQSIPQKQPWELIEDEVNAAHGLSQPKKKRLLDPIYKEDVFSRISKKLK